MNLCKHVMENYSVYPRVLGYHYQKEIELDKKLLDEINSYEFVMINSDFGTPILDCEAIQLNASADCPEQWMWLEQDYSAFKTMWPSDYTKVPTVGFVGRMPVIQGRLHRGFEYRYEAFQALYASQNICTDFHIRTEPGGDSCGFWNESMPDFNKNQPLFKANMLGCQYQVCARGNANWSLRFYETLAYGRIPVFIDSGGKFPLFQGTTKQFDDFVGGFPFPVIYDMEDIEKEILEFHEGIKDDEGMLYAQEACRAFYDKCFSQEAQIREFDYAFGHLKLSRG